MRLVVTSVWQPASVMETVLAHAFKGGNVLYWVIGGIAGWLTLIWFFLGIPPVVSMQYVAEYFGIPIEPQVKATSLWFIERADSMVILVLVMGLAGALYGAGWARRAYHLLGENRGSASLWISTAFAAQLVEDSPSRLVAIISTLALAVTFAATAWWASPENAPGATGLQGLAQLVYLVFVGCSFTAFFPVFILAHLLGGSRAQPLKKTSSDL